MIFSIAQKYAASYKFFGKKHCARLASRILLQRSFYQCYKQWMRVLRSALVFRMELYADEEGMAGELHHLHKAGGGVCARSHKTGGGKIGRIFSVELIAVAVTLVDKF
jgi:hypothetical protein